MNQRDDPKKRPIVTEAFTHSLLNFSCLEFFGYLWSFCFFFLPFLPSFLGRDSLKKARIIEELR